MTSNHYPQKSMSDVLPTFKNIVAYITQAIETGAIEEVLQQIAEECKILIGVKYAALGIPDGQGGLRYFKTAGIPEKEIAKIAHPPVGKGLLGAIMNEHEILRLPDMKTDKRSVDFPENHPPMTSLLGVPVLVGNELFGMLYLCDRLDGQPFDEQDQWLVESFAGYAALAIAGMQLSEQQTRLTLLEERERVGMELHDGVIQALYAIGMQLQLAVLSEATTIDEISNAISQIDSVISDIRHYILNLKNTNYQQITLNQCFNDIVARLHVPSHIQVEVEAKDEIPQIPSIAIEAICQITLEALSNAIRHAQAEHIKITATQDKSALTVCVSDDGQGFDIGIVGKNQGLGLQNIQQRANLHGGTVKINSEVGKGTNLMIAIPRS